MEAGVKPSSHQQQGLISCMLRSKSQEEILSTGYRRKKEAIIGGKNKVNKFVITFIFRFQNSNFLPKFKTINKKVVNYCSMLKINTSRDRNIVQDFAGKDMYFMSAYLTRLLQNFVNWGWLR